MRTSESEHQTRQSNRHDFIAVALARLRDWPYLSGTGRQTVLETASGSFGQMVEMAYPLSTAHPMRASSQPARKLAGGVVAGAAGLGSAILFGALVLWFHYGTAVFFEMIASGIFACF